MKLVAVAQDLNSYTECKTILKTMAAYGYQEKIWQHRNCENHVKIRGWGYKISQNWHANNMYPNIFVVFYIKHNFLVFRPWFLNFNNV